MRADHRDDLYVEIEAERLRQDARWGEQNHRDGTDTAYATAAARVRDRNDRKAADGTLTWLDILDEEVAEVFSESDEAKLRAELIQTAAVALAWVEAIDRRPLEDVSATPLRVAA